MKPLTRSTAVKGINRSSNHCHHLNSISQHLNTSLPSTSHHRTYNSQPCSHLSGLPPRPQGSTPVPSGSHLQAIGPHNQWTLPLSGIPRTLTGSASNLCSSSLCNRSSSVPVKCLIHQSQLLHNHLGQKHPPRLAQICPPFGPSAWPTWATSLAFYSSWMRLTMRQGRQKITHRRKMDRTNMVLKSWETSFLLSDSSIMA